jgi:hypothetical protein
MEYIIIIAQQTCLDKDFLGRMEMFRSLLSTHWTCPPASASMVIMVNDRSDRITDSGAAPWQKALRRCAAASAQWSSISTFRNKNQRPKITFRKPRRFSEGPGFPQPELMSQGPTKVSARWPADQDVVLNASRDQCKLLEGMPNWTFHKAKVRVGVSQCEASLSGSHVTIECNH